MLLRAGRVGKLGLLLLCAGAVPAIAQTRSLAWVPVVVNGNRLGSDAVMVQDAARTLLPMRALFTALGVNVVWNGDTKTVVAWKEDGTGIRFGVEDLQAKLLKIEGTPGTGKWGPVVGTRSLDAPAMLIGQRIHIPLRAAAEALNADVRWNARERTVLVTTPAGQGLPPEPGKAARALDVSLTVQKERLAPGDYVLFRLVVKNAGGNAVRVPFGSGQQFDFEVRRSDELVWNWAGDRVFTQALTSLTLEPGGSRTFDVRWDLKTNEGKIAPKGTYTVRGLLTSSEETLRLDDEKKVQIIR